MKFSIVLLSFMKFRWSDLVHFAMFISLMLYNCPLFNNPPVTQAEFNAAILDLQTKGVIAYIPLPENINNRDNAVAIVQNMLRQLASYTNMISCGDKFTIFLSGFSARVFTNHNIKKVFNVFQGTISGQVIAEWGSIDKAASYVIRYSIDEDGLRDKFNEIGIGNLGLTINGLTRGKDYLFSLAVVYSNHQGEFCSPLSLMVV